MADKPEYLTKEKFDELTKELEHLKSDRRREVAEHLEYAKSLGDLAENAEYHEARSEQANLEDRIMKLEMMLKSAVIVSHTDATDVVDIGSIVTIEKGGVATTYTIVGSEEADIASGKLSLNSPLGECLLGKKKSETVSCKTPNGMVKYTVKDIK